MTEIASADEQDVVQSIPDPEAPAAVSVAGEVPDAASASGAVPGAVSASGAPSETAVETVGRLTEDAVRSIGGGASPGGTGPAVRLPRRSQPQGREGQVHDEVLTGAHEIQDEAASEVSISVPTMVKISRCFGGSSQL